MIGKYGIDESSYFGGMSRVTRKSYFRLGSDPFEHITGILHQLIVLTKTLLKYLVELKQETI